MEEKGIYVRKGERGERGGTRAKKRCEQRKRIKARTCGRTKKGEETRDEGKR